MMSNLKQAVVCILVGIIYWSAFSAISAVNEPWDGTYYWLAAYPGSILIAIALGFVFRRHAWITGLAITFAQFPIIAVNTGIGPLSLFAVAFLAVLSVPVILAAARVSMRRP